MRGNESKAMNPRMISFGSVANRFHNVIQFWPSLVSPYVFRSLHEFFAERTTYQPVSGNFHKDASKSVDFSEKTILETISSYGNDWSRALEFFNWAPQQCQFKHTVESYNCMVDILGKFFEFNLAWDLIRQMQSDSGISPDSATFRIMFKRYAAAHLVQEAIDTYNRAGEFGLKDRTTFLNLIDALCEYKHVIEAQELCMKTMLNYFEDTKIHNMILRGLFKIGWWSRCRDFWEEMESKGVPRDLHSYSIYMDILSKSGKPWKAVKIYKEMKRKGIKLDIVAYNTVLQSVGLCDGADASIRLYREMLELGLLPNIVTYNTIIKLLCESGRIRDAYRYLDQIRKNGCNPNCITYHCFFKYLSRPKEILQLFERMLESGPTPRMETYVMLIKKFGRWGFLQDVFLVWKRMQDQGLSPDGFAYNAMIDALLQKGMVEMARQFDEEMLDKGLSAKPRRELGTKVLNEVSDNELEFVRL
ncbi:pentatricopeptide repeat-containing protein At1g80550, mitochondrial [Aristolochia californica]|uniref:pentatricopeptide repeat-containing protein At1g80550, mitochondrial n=1 Tax=Aristolochia californica TaxID=171875 RepID=UPI0035D80E35